MSMADHIGTQPPMMNAALEYARKGIPVFPCNIEKKPMTAHGFKDATTDQLQIVQWWTANPSAIIGVPTGQASGWAVIDLDHKPNKFGQMRNGTAALMQITGGELPPDTVEAKTPTGGRHIYLRNRPEFRCSTDDELGIDVRAEGGYVCVPPSPGYMFTNPPGLFDVAEPPEFLHEILTKGTRRRVHEDFTPPPQTAVTPAPAANDTEPEDVATILNEFWNPDDYQDWSTAALALHNMPDGYAIWSQWAAKSPKFNVAENLRKWNQTTPSKGITARSILARAPRERLSELGKARHPRQEYAMFQGVPATGAGQQEGGQLFQRAKAFAASWKPAEYLVDGIIQRGYCYSLTSPTGGGKTAVILNLAACVGSGRSFAGAETLPGKVGYFAAENPNDIQARWHGLTEAMNLDDPNVYFCPFTIDLSTSFDALKAEAEAAGGFDLIVVDTSQAFFGGDDENNNAQMVGHAKGMRKLTTLPGNPCVIILTHPVKNPSKDNLLPRGGGGFLAEVDGNLTIWNDNDNITLHHQGKFRGAGFAPINFVLKGVQPAALKDAKGRQIPTVVAEHVTEEAFRKRLSDNATDQDKVMILLLSRKGNISMADIARMNDWVSPLGTPQKSKVSRLIQQLKDAKLVVQKRSGVLALTKAGKAEIGPKARALGIDGAGDENDDF